MAKKKAAPKKAKKQKPAPKKAKAKAKSSAVKAKASAPVKAKAIAKGKIAATAKSKVAPKAKGRIVAKAKPAKTTIAKARTAPRRSAASDPDTDLRANQEVEIVSAKPRYRVARAGAGSGDLQGISTVEDVDSESEDELLEEGQSFEAGIIGGVERAGDEEGAEVVTHEVLEDDVPREYDDEDRP